MPSFSSNIYDCGQSGVFCLGLLPWKFSPGGRDWVPHVSGRLHGFLGEVGVTFFGRWKDDALRIPHFLGGNKISTPAVFPKMHTQRWTAGTWKWWFGSDDFPLFSGYSFTLGLFLLGRNVFFSRKLLPPRKHYRTKKQQGPYLKCIAILVIWVVATQIFLYFHLENWEHDPIWLAHIFQMGCFHHHRFAMISPGAAGGSGAIPAPRARSGKSPPKSRFLLDG